MTPRIIGRDTNGKFSVSSSEPGSYEASRSPPRYEPPPPISSDSTRSFVQSYVPAYLDNMRSGIYSSDSKPKEKGRWVSMEPPSFLSLVLTLRQVDLVIAAAVFSSCVLPA